MSIFDDKTLKSVADAVSKVLEQTEPKNEKEKKLAALAHPKDKITHKDVLVGRGVLKKEEAEQIDEVSKQTLGSYIKKASHDITAKGAATRQFANDSQAAKDKHDNVGARKSMEKADKTFAKSWKRREGMAKAVDRLTKEDIEQVEEEMLEEGWAEMQAAVKAKSVPTPSGGAGKKQGTRYGGSKQAPDVEDDEEEKKPARGKYGARQNFKRSMKEGFSTLIGAYTDHGLKGLSEHLISEEPDNEQFTKEVEDQKKSMEGKKKQPSVAAPATQGVKQMPEEVQVEEVKDEYARKVDKYLRKKYNKMNKEEVELDADEINGVAIETIEERSLTEPEMKKREEYAKGMKKKLSGFKQRYGERAKEVMYATATKMAKKD